MDEREESFEELKRRLLSALILTLSSGSGGFLIYSDATWLCVPSDQVLHEKVMTEAHSSPFTIHP
nr:putative reverse transcriptase domain, aspartic peptidase domain protein [Tanacetum cinerariifolium]